MRHKTLRIPTEKASSGKPPIRVFVNANLADFPQFIQRGQRHLEKGKFDPVFTGSKVGFQIPTDILSLTLPIPCVDKVEEVIFVYHK